MTALCYSLVYRLWYYTVVRSHRNRLEGAFYTISGVEQKFSNETLHLRKHKLRETRTFAMLHLFRWQNQLQLQYLSPDRTAGQKIHLKKDMAWRLKGWVQVLWSFNAVEWYNCKKKNNNNKKTQIKTLPQSRQSRPLSWAVHSFRQGPTPGVIR